MMKWKSLFAHLIVPFRKLRTRGATKELIAASSFLKEEPNGFQAALQNVTSGSAGPEALFDLMFRSPRWGDPIAFILDGVDLAPSAMVLELGCGGKKHLISLAGRVAKTYGLDVSLEGSEPSASLDRTAATAQIIPSESLGQWPAASVDFIVAATLFQQIPNSDRIAALVQEAGRLLRPGGLFRFHVMGRWAGRSQLILRGMNGYIFSPSAVRELLAAGGFRLRDQWGEGTPFYWITAQREDATINTVSMAAVAPFRERVYDQSLLAELFSRLQLPDAMALADQVAQGSTSLRSALEPFEATIPSESNQAFLQVVYWQLLGRSPEAEEMRFYLPMLDADPGARPLIFESILAERLLEIVRPFPVDVPWSRAEGIHRCFATATAEPSPITRPPAGSLFDLADIVVANIRTLPPRNAVGAAFQAVLGQWPDEHSLRHYMDQMGRTFYGCRLVVRELLSSEAPSPPPPPSADRLKAFYARAGITPPSLTTLGVGESLPGEAAIAHHLLNQSAALTDRAFVRFCYERVLGRPCGDDGMSYYFGKLSRREFNRPHMMQEFLWSRELREATVAPEFKPPEEVSEIEREARKQRMTQDWDQRARDNFKLAIAAGHSHSDDSFQRSGLDDLDRLILDGIEISPQASVLEIGCGVGRILLPFSQRVTEAYGLDISQVMIEKSRAYCQSAPNVKTFVTDGTLKQIADGSLDFVYSFIVFQHILDWSWIATYVRESARALRPGGLFRFQVDGRWEERIGWNPDTYDGVTFSPQGIRELLAGTGLSIVEESGEETHYHWVTARLDRGTPTARVRFHGRLYDERQLLALFNRLGLSGAAELTVRVQRGEIGLRRALGHFEDRLHSLSNEKFLTEVYRLLLERTPDAEGLAFYKRVLDEDLEDRRSTVDTFLTSQEFRDRMRPLVRSMYAR